MTNIPSCLHSEGRLILVCALRWMNYMTPHTSWALLTWEVMSRCSTLHFCHFMPCLMPTRTLSDCPAHTFQHLVFKKNQISCQNFDVPHISCQFLCHFTPSFPSPPLSCCVAFRQMRMRSFWISIIYYNCPLREARRDSSHHPSLCSLTRFSCVVCTLSPLGILRKDANVLDWVWW